MNMQDQYTPFAIEAGSFGWIDDAPDDPLDLCAHGRVTVRVGERTLAYDCCVSASALRMLKTLTEDHRRDGEEAQMLPCCGHFMVADEAIENVWIDGCGYGVDYDVLHSEGEVLLVTEAGERFRVLPEDYRRAVVTFARQVEEFYRGASPKVLPEDEFERNGYLAFWNEWHRRMDQAEGRQRERGGREMTEVVAALIWEGEKFMICQRPAQKARGLLWEFVGGKVEPGETKEEALIRECREELGVTVAVEEPFMEVTHAYPDLTVHLTLFHAAIAEGVPQKLEHNDIRFITVKEIPQYEFCPADQVILEKLIREAGRE